MMSARNKLEGIVTDVKLGEVAALVKVELTNPDVITAMITREAVEELGLKPGDKVRVVIKATEVMVEKE
ncbi:molybdenum-pterin-binding protein [Thermococcus sp. CX2]|uniref:TOBE domain-containing protein n=1 Tax=Thermococcus sp. CX2 TaxID=163006 RepID=UPI0014386D7B|nr:TOBE domain-containing protein [Thermococcus sp. CX2]NJE85864.1 molybdenum-pterin-binding protein [Thermococcus sp. CX2]